jgi:hypothetical protein
MGRKMRVNDGGAFKVFIGEIKTFCRRHEYHKILGEQVNALSRAVLKLEKMAQEMVERFQSDALQWASYTYPALICFGEITMIWRLLDMAVAAQGFIDDGLDSDYYHGKIMQATYFSDVTLPMSLARMESCVREGREIIDMPEGAF